MNENIKIKRLKNLNSILHRQGEFSALVSKANKLEYINSILQRKLDPDLSLHCKVGDWSFVNHSMTLLTNSAAWQYRIRFDLNKILQHIQQIPGFSRITILNLQVDPNMAGNVINQQPKQTSKTTPAAAWTMLDNGSRDALLDAANNTQSEKLKIALQNLLGNTL